MSCVILLITLLTACADASEPGTLPEVERREAKTALSAALDELAQADTGFFKHAITSRVNQLDPILTISGGYVLSTAAFETFIDVDAAGERTRIVLRSVDGVMYLHVPTWPEAIKQCWAVMDESAFGEGPTEGLIRYPAALLALETARGMSVGSRGHNSEIMGSIDLTTAVAVLAPKLALDPAYQPKSGRVPALFALRDGELASMTVQGKDMQEGLENQGVEVPDDFAEVLQRLSARVDYSLQGEPAAVTAPPKALRMTREQADAGRSCPEGSSG